MPTQTRHAAWALLAMLCGCQQPPLQGSFHCPNHVKFHYNRQSQTVELTYGNKTYQGIMDEKRLMTWPNQNGNLPLPDSYALTRKDPKVLMLYGGFAGTGLACERDAG
jgi:hypothetical protein